MCSQSRTIQAEDRLILENTLPYEWRYELLLNRSIINSLGIICDQNYLHLYDVLLALYTVVIYSFLSISKEMFDTYVCTKANESVYADIFIMLIIHRIPT